MGGAAPVQIAQETNWATFTGKGIPPAPTNRTQPRRRVSSAAEEQVDSGSELSDLSPGDGESEDEDRVTWLGKTTGGRHSSQVDDHVAECRSMCNEEGCVTVVHCEAHFEEERFEMNNHGLGRAGTIALALEKKSQVLVERVNQ